MIQARRSAVQEWRDNYPLLATCFVGYGISTMAVFSVGVFLDPIEAELGWGRGAISGALMAQSVIAFLLAGFAGRLMDRFGLRRVGIAGIVIYCAGISLLGTTGSEIWQWWALWFIIAIGLLFVNPTLWASAISRNFDASRGLALAVTTSGSSIMLIFMPAILTALIVQFSWRITYVGLGIVSLAAALPLMLLFLRDGPHVKVSASVTNPGAAMGPTVRSQLFTSRFLRLALACFLLAIATMGMQTHFIPLLLEGGIGRGEAAAMAGFIGLGAVAGRLCCGILLDRLRGQLVGAVFFAAPILSSLILLFYDGSMLSGSFAGFIHGLALGAEMDIVTFLIGRYFGLQNYGALVGVVIGGVILAAGIGPTLAGLMFDVSGSYAGFLIVMIASFSVSSVMLATLGDYPRDLQTADAEAAVVPGP